MKTLIKMKKMALAALIASTFLVGCTKTPSSIALKYAEAMKNGQVAEAVKYTTEQSTAMIELAVKLDRLKTSPNSQLSTVKEVVNGNVASVGIEVKPSLETNIIFLVKVGEEWKVDLLIEDSIKAQIRKNFQQIEACVWQFKFDKSANPTQLSQLIGPDPGLYLKKLTAIDGEDYNSVDLKAFAPGVIWRIKTKSGVEASYVIKD